VNHWESSRIRLDGFEALIEGMGELVSKVVPSLSVPGEDIVDIDLGG
jgi:hypothetical protein